MLDFIKNLVSKNSQLRKEMEIEASKLENVLKGDIYSHAFYKLGTIKDDNIKLGKKLVVKLEKTSQIIQKVVQ